MFLQGHIFCSSHVLSNSAEERNSRRRNAGDADQTSIVFAHGLWADGPCFNKVIPTLQAEGTRWCPPRTAWTHSKAMSPQ